MRARPVLPGEVAMVTRRCLERRNLLTPTPWMRNLMGYCFTVGAMKYNIGIIALCGMSNHCHDVINDHDGKRPAFFGWVYSQISRASNAHPERRRSGKVWDEKQTNVVLLLDAESTLDKAAYVLTNPAAAGAVDDGDDWPGLRVGLGVGDDPESLTFTRPDWYMGPDSGLPEKVTLKLEAPPGYDLEAWRRDLAAKVKRREAGLRRRRAEEGRTVQGVEKVLAQDWRSAPSTPSPRSRLVPTVACKEPEVRRQKLLDLARFRAEYAEARDALQLGQRDVLFPEGSYMAERMGLRVRGRPDPAEAQADQAAPLRAPPPKAA